MASCTADKCICGLDNLIQQDLENWDNPNYEDAD